MSRNIDRDKNEEIRRRRELLDAGLRLFSEKGIESVSLQSVVNETNVGIATMYNYYKNKVNFVVAISTDMWSSFWNEVLTKIEISELFKYNTYELTELYCNLIIGIYRQKPEMLKFSSNYKTFIQRENVPDETVNPHLEALEPIRRMYHEAYTRDIANGAIRSDISEDELFRTSALTMLAMAERFAEGIVWAKGTESSHISELNQIKEMILLWCRSGR